MSLHSGIAPNQVLTGLDEVFFSTFNENPGPNMGRPDDNMIFKQSTASNSGVITEVMSDVGLWDSRQELEPLTEGTPQAGDKRTFNVANFAKSLPISKHYFDDEMFDAVNTQVEKMAKKGRLTQYNEAFRIYREGTTNTTTNNGTVLFSATQSNLNGDTIDNLDANALAEGALNTGITTLVEQKDQSGDIVGHEANCLLVPPALFKTACEITDSELRSGTANNDVNVYSSKYNLYVKQSQYLGAAAGGSDTAWFLLSNDHTIHRWVRQGIVTDLVDYKYADNFVYTYKAEYRERYGAVTYEGTYQGNA